MFSLFDDYYDYYCNNDKSDGGPEFVRIKVDFVGEVDGGFVEDGIAIFDFVFAEIIALVGSAGDFADAVIFFGEGFEIKGIVEIISDVFVRDDFGGFLGTVFYGELDKDISR